MSKDIKSFIESLIPSSNNSLKEKCFNIFQENGIETTDDLLCLTEKDIDTFSLPLVFKRKMLDEMNKLKTGPSLTDVEKNMIKSFFDNDIALNNIYQTINVELGTPKADLVLQYYNSLQKPKKPIPKDLKQLHVKTTEKSLPCYQYPSKELRGRRYYTLLVMGETGSGKTTLLDAFVNYLAGINFIDDWRYKLVDENHLKDRPGDQSQTEVITSYYVNFHRDEGREINIRIIDTPGLGDTKGVLQDNLIIKQFEELFKEIGELDYILVTVKANITRWTNATQYVYDRVQQVFGKDAVHRFMLMCTFADGQTPLSLDTLKGKFLYQDYFCFNNSALYVPSSNAGPNTKTFWRLCISSVKKFFDVILEKNLPPLSLTLTKQVMEYRDWLYESVHSSKERINEGFRLLEKSNNLLEAIKKNKKQLDENGSFTYEDYEEISKEIPLPTPYQWCNNCGCLCCQICAWPEGAVFSQCTYFNGGRGCPKCRGCPREAHRRATHTVTVEKVKVTKIYKAKKELFEKGKKGLSASESALEKEINKMSELGKSILDDMQKIKNSLIELDKIALKPRVFTNEQYFKEMIEYEETEKNPGWENRVEGLKMMRDQAKHINDISKAENISNLFPQYNNILKELKNKKPEKASSSNCIVF